MFPDQTIQFVKECEIILEAAMGRKIAVLTPLIEFTKSDVLAMARIRGLCDTYSCHAGGDTPCGICVACVEIASAKKERCYGWRRWRFRGLNPDELKDLEQRAKGSMKISSESGKCNVFISFASEDINDVNMLRGQAKNQNSDIEFNDWSLKKPLIVKRPNTLNGGLGNV